MAREKGKSAHLKRLIKQIAQNIVKQRINLSWTQEKTAEKLGCDLRWYQRLESGNHTFSLETLTRLAEVFKIKERDLLDHDVE